MEARKRIDELERELLAADRINAVEAFGSSLAHELNQPLATIANYARIAEMLIAQNNPGDESLKECMEGISAAANRAGVVVRSMRALVQRDYPKHEVFGVRDAAEAAIAMVNLGIIGRFSAAVDIDPALKARGDRILIEQVFINLLRNACEATDMPVTISLSAQRTSDLIKVCVEDDGPGFEDDGLQGLFRPLRTTKKEGIGLGLPICRTIVEALGGELAIRAARDQGALVSFTIPAAPAHDDPLASESLGR